MADPRTTRTLEEDALEELSNEEAPGLVVIFSEGRPRMSPLHLGRHPVEIGRTPAEGVHVIVDDRASRRHARVELAGDGVRVTDLESRNGTFVDGRRIQDEVFRKMPRILRVGQTLFRFTHDLGAFLKRGVDVTADEVVGPLLGETRDRIARATASGDTLLLTGPSGTGKEHAARAFHRAGKRSGGPFVAVNCAAIPVGLAERLLFGANKGAYSGANVDAEGYVQAADKGTLFLDEIAELDLGVQPKLLRVLETREVLALGAVRPRKVDLQFCAATLKDLRAEVGAGRFREDLYFRVGQPEVHLPTLIERLEEIPWLATVELAKIHEKLAASSSFVEACALRAWRGNVREFLGEVRQAGRAALDDGRLLVEAKDLSPAAGEDLSAGEPAASSPDAIEAALRREQGNVTRAARALGWHRNQLRRWIATNGVDPKNYRG